MPTGAIYSRPPTLSEQSREKAVSAALTAGGVEGSAPTRRCPRRLRQLDEDEMHLLRRTAGVHAQVVLSTAGKVRCTPVLILPKEALDGCAKRSSRKGPVAA
jgi:hypothetical protein